MDDVVGDLAVGRVGDLDPFAAGVVDRVALDDVAAAHGADARGRAGGVVHVMDQVVLGPVVRAVHEDAVPGAVGDLAVSDRVVRPVQVDAGVGVLLAAPGPDEVARVLDVQVVESQPARAAAGDVGGEEVEPVDDDVAAAAQVKGVVAVLGLDGVTFGVVRILRPEVERAVGIAEPLGGGVQGLELADEVIGVAAGRALLGAHPRVAEGQLALGRAGDLADLPEPRLPRHDVDDRAVPRAVALREGRVVERAAGNPVGGGGGGAGNVETGVGPPGLVHHLPIDEDLVKTGPQVPALPGLVDRAAMFGPPVDDVSPADGDLLTVVRLELDGRRAAARAQGADGLAVGAPSDQDGISGLREVGGALDGAERLGQRAGVGVDAAGRHVVRRHQHAPLQLLERSRRADRSRRTRCQVPCFVHLGRRFIVLAGGLGE